MADENNGAKDASEARRNPARLGWGGVVLSLAVAAVFVFFIGYVLNHAFTDKVGSFAVVATLLLVGIAAFIGIMNMLSFSASWLDIKDTRQPFGLPEGTVRAILTIAFIVLVGVFASFLLTRTSEREPFGKAIEVRKGLGAPEAQALEQRLSAQGLVVLVPVPAPTPAAGSAPPAPTFDVQLYPRRDYGISDDIAKQVLTMLSTILAAMIGFYFGARPADAAADATKKTAAEVVAKTAAAAEAAKAPADTNAERLRLLTELNALAGEAPTVETLRAAADAKLSAVADNAAKTAQVQTIKSEIDAIAARVATARTSLGDLSVSREQALNAQAKAKAVLATRADLNAKLQAI
ncbi:MAG TPA: hypothetical protein VF601_15675 [Beijerinckiaceae bacterium]|jgi:hypothetical protein